VKNYFPPPAIRDASKVNADTVLETF